MATSIKTSFWDTNVGKTLKAAGYIALSAVISYLITATTNDATLFGPVTAVINLALVYIQKTFLDSNTRNLGSN